MRIQDVTEDLAEGLGLEEARGALVTDVPEGPAAEAGMQSGDVIVAFEGADISDTRELVRRVGNTEVGKDVRIDVVRNGETETLTVTLGRREDAERAVPASASATEPLEGEALGLSLSEMTEELRAQLGLPDEATGLVVTDVAGDSEAFEKGVRAGDVITEAGQQPVETIGDLEDRIAEAREAGRRSLLMLVRREGDPRFVALSVE